MSLRAGIVLIAGAVAVTLAYQITTRMSQEALQVALGVTCGIAASIPVSLGLLMALLRQREPRGEYDEPAPEPYAGPVYAPRYPQAPTPPVIVITPNQNQPNPYANYLPPGNMLEPPASRDFKIIGGEDDDTLDA
jgi:hypothetical protein